MDNFTFDSEEMLVKYLDNEMSGEEKQAFEKFLSGNPAISSRLENMKIAREAVYQYGLKEQVRSIHREMMTENKMTGRGQSQAPGRLRTMVRFSLSAAAVILIAWFSFRAYIYFTITPEKIYARQFTHYELPVLRGAEQTNQSDLEIAYRDKDYNRVVNLCNSKTDFTALDKYLCGMADMEIKNYPAAINSFQQLIDLNKTNKTSSYNDEAEYNLGLAYLANGAYDQSYAIFSQIQKDPGHLYHDKVTDRLLSRIRRFIK